MIVHYYFPGLGTSFDLRKLFWSPAYVFLRITHTHVQRV